MRVMDHMLGPPSTEGNKVKTLENGHEIFPAMLGAIRAAKETITFEMYIYWSSEIGEQFTAALAERAEAGVKVHVILDAVGARGIDGEYLTRMRKAGVEVAWYKPLEQLALIVTVGHVNHRTHRKLMVVDGRVGFIGGVNVADMWQGDAASPDEWRENHYRVEGPVVASLQAAFVDNWVKGVGQVLDGPGYFPDLQPVGALRCQAFSSSPEAGSADMELMYLLSINAAAESIYIATAYFVPNGLMIDALKAARRRGVSVKIVVPGEHTDVPLTRMASQGRWDELLEAGIEIYEYQPTMYHCKIMVVDRLWSTVGSTNIGPRSFRLNDEANLNIYDAAFAREQIAVIERDIAESKKIDARTHAGRCILDRIGEFFASLLEPQL